MIEFADTTKKLYALLSWAVPRQHIDRLIIEKLIKIATKEEELDHLLRETLVDVHPGLWDLWKQREKEITVNRE
ncbi:MAG: hypothetical protein KAI67_05460 [Candidatus Pacebacteria bacterium]|nr:hypothetical protein [Candidatus Paceibacterota bacterium]